MSKAVKNITALIEAGRVLRQTTAMLLAVVSSEEMDLAEVF